MTAPLNGTTDDRRENDRRTQRRYRFRDLRSGFDRRRHYAFLGTMRDSAWILLGVLLLTNLLSLVDGYLTFVELTAGIAAEGNPVLASLFEAHPISAVAFKVSIVGMVTLVVWLERRRRVMLVVALFASGVYTAVVAYHLGSLMGLGLI